MKRSTAALAISALVVGGIATAATSSNIVPASTAGHSSVIVNGATMQSIAYTFSSGHITGFTVRFRGSEALHPISARFVGDSGVCVMGVYSFSENETPASCTGFSQESDRSWELTITVG